MGGIYVPKDRARPPRFFYLFEKEVHVTEDIGQFVQQRNDQAIILASATGAHGTVGPTVVGNMIGGALVNAIIENGVGKIEWHPPIEDANARNKIYAGIRPASAP